MSDTSWLQAQLPVSLCGMGMRSASRHVSAAYLSSQLQSEALCNQMLDRDSDTAPVCPSTHNALVHLSSILQLEEPLVVGQVAAMSQKELSTRVDEVSHQQLLDSVTEVTDKARLASLGLPHSGDWLFVIPCPTLGLRLRGTEFRVAALYRLGMPVFATGGFCVACGHDSSDRYSRDGHHAIICGSQGERIARHNHLRDAIYATAASAHLAPTKEDKALLPNTENRPADVMIPHFIGGLHAGLDISVINSLQTLTVNRAATEPGYALTLRHQQKYGDACLAEGIRFCPMIVEALGGWHVEAVKILKKLGVALARATGGDEGEVVKQLFGRLSILLQKDNSILILNRTPTTVNAEIDGYL